MFIVELYFIFNAYTPLSACHLSGHVTLFQTLSVMTVSALCFDAFHDCECGGAMSH